jgi:outer membrane protein assembly factor BamB
VNIAPASELTPRKPLRLWLGVALAALLLLFKFVGPIVAPGAGKVALLGSLGCAVAILLWWLFLSRAPWSDRLGAVLLMIVALVGTSRILDASLGAGPARFLFFVLALPPLSLALVAWAVATRGLSDGLRRTTMAAAILIAVGGWVCVRVGGVSNDLQPELHWRWAQTPEERLLAQAANEPLALPAVSAAAPAAPALTPAPAKAAAATALAVPKEAPAASKETPLADADWPGFRGPRRDGIIPGVRIATDWTASPPVELWRRPIGPGWSSFAVHGGLIYTLEQRGDDEVVSCYNAATGKPVWIHRDAARFYESAGGPGPRGTPTFNNGRVYALGATGIVNALKADDGAAVWSRNAASDTGAKMPDWGFAGSPLVVGDIVIVAASGRLVAYDLATGNPRWRVQTGGGGYSSPQLFTIGGVPQVLLMSGHGATSVDPADGKLLWEYAWPKGIRIVQPAQISDGELLITLGDEGGMGTSGVRRIAVARGPGGWNVQERWTSSGLKPNFNDFVVHNGHAFGFDGSILACIDLKDGQRKWKGGRYGGGQLVLLPDQNLLLVLSEEGELALVGATADQFKELARFPAIEGKTWNHPVLVGDRLLVRNGQETAAFRLSLARR